MTKRERNAMIRKIEKSMQRVAAERDKLDEIIDGADHLRRNCQQAYDHLYDAREALSELV